MATYHHGDLRAAVLSAAWELIESQGVARLSVREAARRAGVSHHAPYRHFADRDALLDALVIEGFEQLEKAIEVVMKEIQANPKKLPPRPPDLPAYPSGPGY